jgi:sugar/nucleoside kinase (ribokinase family)
MDPPGDAEVGATEQRVPAIAFPKSDRVDASGAGDAYGD